SATRSRNSISTSRRFGRLRCTPPLVYALLSGTGQTLPGSRFGPVSPPCLRRNVSFCQTLTENASLAWTDRMSAAPANDGPDSVPGLDLDRLADYLAAKAPGLISEPLHATLIAGGRSNLTYILNDIYVVRRPPLGHVLATAHDMAREFRVLSALGPTPVPV